MESGKKVSVMFALSFQNYVVLLSEVLCNVVRLVSRSVRVSFSNPILFFCTMAENNILKLAKLDFGKNLVST